MRFGIVIRHIGNILLFNALFLFVSLLISIYEHDNAIQAFSYTLIISLVFGLFPKLFVPKSDFLTAFEGVLVVTLGWITTCVIGALPFVLFGGEFTFMNAWFETVSGFTTTGSTVLNNIEALPDSILFWRSTTHWIGGIGVILFALVILPASNASRLTLLNTEISEVAKQNFRYRAKQTLHIIAAVYVGLTVLETIALTIAGMGLFDAINHSFATIATGGFSTKNMSVAGFHSVSIEVIIMIFMLLSGIHFGLLFDTVSGKRHNIFNSQIVRWYIIIMFSGILLVSFKLWATEYDSFWTALRYASFQVISLGTTTGFATIDTAAWPFFTQIVLIYFTIQCACVGSTSGGLKFDRVMIFFKSLVKHIKLLQHPRAVKVVKIDGKAISEQVERQTLLFIVFYLFIIFISTLLLTAMDVDIMSAFSATAATIGNVGPGFAKVSSLGNFSTMPDAGKFILSIDMLLGRLEIFGIISLFFLRSWK